mmetsp:Transcript_28525/g.65512  ORF Transcript_28525/g.65512 Transcript_28525/m.65512 type:complete len:315 (-) Transcript_28525:105-1049(-)
MRGLGGAGGGLGGGPGGGLGSGGGSRLAGAGAVTTGATGVMALTAGAWAAARLSAIREESAGSTAVTAVANDGCSAPTATTAAPPATAETAVTAATALAQPRAQLEGEALGSLPLQQFQPFRPLRLGSLHALAIELHSIARRISTNSGNGNGGAAEEAAAWEAARAALSALDALSAAAGEQQPAKPAPDEGHVCPGLVAFAMCVLARASLAAACRAAAAGDLEELGAQYAQVRALADSAYILAHKLRDGPLTVDALSILSESTALIGDEIAHATFEKKRRDKANAFAGIAARTRAGQGQEDRFDDWRSLASWRL